MLPVTQYEFDMLGAALDQGGWKIECQFPREGATRMLDILNFNLGQVSNASCNATTLDLYLRNGKEKQEHFTGKIRRVLIEGQLGIIDSELRRFAVSFYHLPEKSRRQAREDAKYWRKLGPGIGFGLVFVRDKDAPPGWPLKSDLNNSRTFRYSRPQELHSNDELADRQRVLSAPRQGLEGVIFIHLTDGGNSRWEAVPARIPIALRD